MAVRNQPNENNARTEEEVDAQSRDYQQRLIILEKKIAKRGDRELKILQKAGLDRQAMTRLLALAVMPGPDLAETMRQFQDHLKNLSKRIDAVLDKANAVSADPMYRVQAWAFLTGGGSALGMKFPKSWKGDPDAAVTIAIASMSFLAKTFKQEAKRFGGYLRRYGQLDTGVALILWYVLRRNWKFKKWNELALLLDLAFEAAETPRRKGRVYSADGLRLTARRHGRRFVYIWLKNSLPEMFRQGAQGEIEPPPVPVKGILGSILAAEAPTPLFSSANK
jgi:hypothetical protein